MKVPKREMAEVLVDTPNVSSEPVNTVAEEIVEEKTFNPPTPVVVNSVKSNNTVTNVTIRLNKNHSCYIGGTYYVFEKNKVYQVPPDVKRILSVAGLLAPL